MDEEKEDGTGPCTNAEFYDFETDTWTTLPDLPERLERCTAATHNNKIYIKGS
jgi:hypothetical protein